MRDKYLRFLLIPVSFFLGIFLLSCKVEEEALPDLSGTWIRTDRTPLDSTNDTIVFHSSSYATVYGHEFLYYQKPDTLVFTYSGPVDIRCAATPVFYSFSSVENQLTLENLHVLCLTSAARGLTFYRRLNP